MSRQLTKNEYLYLYRKISKEWKIIKCVNITLILFFAVFFAAFILNLPEGEFPLFVFFPIVGAEGLFILIYFSNFRNFKFYVKQNVISIEGNFRIQRGASVKSIDSYYLGQYLIDIPRHWITKKNLIDGEFYRCEVVESGTNKNSQVNLILISVENNCSLESELKWKNKV